MASLMRVNGKLMFIMSSPPSMNERLYAARELARAAGISDEQARRAITHGAPFVGTKYRSGTIRRNKAGDVWVNLERSKAKDSAMNKTESAEVERILRIAHRVAKRAVMDARTADK